MPDIRILVVDDEPLVSEFIRLKLSREAPHFTISVVTSGKECIDYVTSNHVDCILSDYQMPVMNGIELLMRLKELGYGIPFIFVTGQGNEETAREAFKQGAADYFTKDIGFAHFPRIINSIEQAVAYGRAREEKELARKDAFYYSRKLEALTEACLALNAVLDVPVVMRSLVEHALTLVDGSSGAAGTLLEGKMVFKEYHTGEGFVPIDYSFGPGYGVPGHVMETEQPYVTNDAENDPNVIKEIRAALGFSSLIDVPIINRDGKLHGCFEIHNKKGEQPFDSRDVSLLQGLSAAAATAIDNARLLGEVESSRREWEQTFNVISDLVSVQSADFTILKANDAVARAFGLRPDEVIGKKCYELFHGSDMPIPGCPGMELLDGDSKYVMHEVEVAGRVFEVNVYPVRKDGELMSFVHIAKDVTGRRKVEDVLKHEKGRLDAILESVADGISIQDTDLKVLYQNPAHKAMTGDHLGEYCYRAYEKEEDVCDGCPVAKAFKDGKTHKAVRVLQREDGERHFDITASILRDETGKIVAGIETVRDVTERKEVEDRLAFERAQLVALIDNLSEYAYVSDPYTYEVLYANTALKERLGRDPVGGLCYREFQKMDAPCGFCTNDIILKDKGKVYRWENANPMVGKELLLEDIIIKWPDGRDVRFELAIDISERKAVERQMENFLNIVAHDLKSPIMAIKGYAELIHQSMFEKDDKENLGMVMAIERSGTKLMNMVNDFLTVSRHESGKLGFNPQPVDINKLLHEAATDFSILAENAGIELTFEAEDGLPVVMADIRLLERAVVNLLQNAVNYTPRGGNVSLAAGIPAGDPGYVSISVSDTGAGIPRAERSLVFEKFYRSAGTGRAAGSGIGLATVKAVSELHGGRVELESEEGAGSVFRILLPVKT